MRVVRHGRMLIRGNNYQLAHGSHLIGSSQDYLAIITLSDGKSHVFKWSSLSIKPDCVLVARNERVRRLL